MTLDGNEQYERCRCGAALWRRIGEDKRLARLKVVDAADRAADHPRAGFEQAGACAWPIRSPVEIDESDADFDVFPRARALGYRGISSKSCKGFYRALLNSARVAQYNDEEGGGFVMSAEDLTTQGGIAVQQDLALASLVGATHVERNGHHYVDGMAGAPQTEQDAFLTAHRRSLSTRRRMAGPLERFETARSSLRLDCAGQWARPVAVMPDWNSHGC